jgi:UDP-N-acetylmuramate--alanine ligase
VISPDATAQIPDEIHHAHFIGIGGSGMSGIASMFQQRGVTVSGSDRSANDYTDRLAAAGATVSIGHDAANLADTVDTVVVTSALWPDNPELVLARERGLNILHRSQALVWLTRGSRVIAVAGAHGKTTSTGMIASSLLELGADPSLVNGGVIRALGTNEHLGADREFAVEADESDGSFLFYDTAIALITNVDNDHLDHYGTEEAFEAAFIRFADRASEVVIVSGDDPLAVEITGKLAHPNVVRFGEAEGNHVRVSNIAPAGARRSRQASTCPAATTRSTLRGPSPCCFTWATGSPRRPPHSARSAARSVASICRARSMVFGSTTTTRTTRPRSRPHSRPPARSSARAESSPCTSRTCSRARRR